MKCKIYPASAFCHLPSSCGSIVWLSSLQCQAGNNVHILYILHSDIELLVALKTLSDCTLIVGQAKSFRILSKLPAGIHNRHPIVHEILTMVACQVWAWVLVQSKHTLSAWWRGPLQPQKAALCNVELCYKKWLHIEPWCAGDDLILLFLKIKDWLSVCGCVKVWPCVVMQKPFCNMC